MHIHKYTLYYTYIHKHMHTIHPRRSSSILLLGNINHCSCVLLAIYLHRLHTTHTPHVQYGQYDRSSLRIVHINLFTYLHCIFNCFYIIMLLAEVISLHRRTFLCRDQYCHQFMWVLTRGFLQVDKKNTFLYYHFIFMLHNSIFHSLPRFIFNFNLFLTQK